MSPLRIGAQFAASKDRGHSMVTRVAKPVRRRSASANRAEIHAVARVLRAEAQAIHALADHLGPAVVEAANCIDGSKGRIISTGIGKSGFVAQKFSATLASAGISSFFLHAAEAMHGDLGRVVSGDVVVAFSNSGATEELLKLVRPLERLGAKLVAICGPNDSPLARAAQVVISIGETAEAPPVGLIPTVSTASILAASDALALILAQRRGFNAAQYLRFHPAGKLGRSARTVADLMRRGPTNPLVRRGTPLSKAIAVMTQTPMRPGAVAVVDAKGKLLGIFTDGDLRRLVEGGNFDIRAPVESVMTRNPSRIGPDALALFAERLMRRRSVDQLPVVDAAGVAVGLLDVQDILNERV